MRMNLADTFQSSQSLASFFRGGLEMQKAVLQMSKIQPQYADFWIEASQSIEAGNNISISLEKVWPESLVNSVKAGEESGMLTEVFESIQDAVQLQLGVKKTFGKLIYPISIGGLGLAAFLAIMSILVPMVARSFPNKRMQQSMVTKAGMSLEAFFKDYWMLSLIAIVIAVVLFVRWAKTDEGQTAILEFALKVPMLGNGVKLIYFGLWAKYMAMTFRAGLAVDRCFELAMKVLPQSQRIGFELVLIDIGANSLSIADAIDVEKMAEHDPRRDWPVFIGNALNVGSETGAIDASLDKASPELTRNGTAVMERFISVANIVATVISAAMIGSTFLAIYLPMFTAMQKLR